jgi:hypothetical protein
MDAEDAAPELVPAVGMCRREQVLLSRWRPNVVIESEDAERTWRLKVRSLSKCAPVLLGKDPNLDADWVIVCTRVREENPRCSVLTSGEVSKLANRDKRGPNYWLETAQYDTEEFAERWDRIKPSHSRSYTQQSRRWQKPE